MVLMIIKDAYFRFWRLREMWRSAKHCLFFLQISMVQKKDPKKRRVTDERRHAMFIIMEIETIQKQNNFNIVGFFTNLQIYLPPS